VFLNFYNLREQPFGTTPNPRFLYPSVVHREALASLVYGIESNLGFAALIAEPGMGKTTLLFHVLNRLKNSARTAFLFETQCNSQSLLRYLLAELRVPTTEHDPVVLHEKFKQVLYEESRMGRRLIVIIDEAQNLDLTVLETVRLLSDFETPEAKLLHIILVGQPQLAEKLGSPRMSQLLQRIPIMNFLRPLNAAEVTEYVNHRLQIAGYSGPPFFTTSAFERIAELSGGVPRQINRICFNALSLGCALRKTKIDKPMVDEVGSDLDLGLLLKNLKASHPAPAADAVSVPDNFPQTTEVPCAEGEQATKVTVAENVVPETTHAPASPSTPGKWRKQPSNSREIHRSPDNDLSDLDNQHWKEVVGACTYIKDFLARFKPVLSDPQA